MKTIIFWFSGTGNSLAIARDLATVLGEAELVPMIKCMSGSIPAADKAGCVFPVYAFGLPGIVAEFLRKLPVNPHAYYFTVANCAGLPGALHHQAQSILQSRGGRLAAGWTLFMPSNYPIMTNPPPEDKQRSCFEKSKERVVEISEMVRQEQSVPLENSSAPFRWISPFINFMALRQFRKGGKNFWVESTCRQCGLCAQVCPVANIRIVDKKPTWLQHCEQCMACLQWCPVEAIQYGQATESRKRYHHPQAKDFILRGV